MRKLAFILLNILYICSISVLGLSVYRLSATKKEALQKGEGFTSNFKPEQTTVENPNSCDLVCEENIDEAISEAIATLSATKQEVVKYVQDTSVKTTYIPMGSSTIVTSTDWVDVPDSGVYIDLERDYGKSAKVSWEASLKVAHGNGKAFARLYDDTNKIAVDYSEITTENNVNFKQLSSGNLPFWRGRNLYKVQLKSLNSFEITYGGGKIKVSY